MSRLTEELIIWRLAEMSLDLAKHHSCNIGCCSCYGYWTTYILHLPSKPNLTRDVISYPTHINTAFNKHTTTCHTKQLQNLIKSSWLNISIKKMQYQRHYGPKWSICCCLVSTYENLTFCCFDVRILLRPRLPFCPHMFKFRTKIKDKFT